MEQENAERLEAPQGEKLSDAWLERVRTAGTPTTGDQETQALYRRKAQAEFAQRRKVRPGGDGQHDACGQRRARPKGGARKGQ